MALSANQPKRGTQHGKSPADEASRTGRDSGQRTPAKGYTEKGKSKPEPVARTGRGEPSQGGHANGIGRGRGDAGSDSGVSGIPDGVGGSFPSA